MHIINITRYIKISIVVDYLQNIDKVYANKIYHFKKPIIHFILSCLIEMQDEDKKTYVLKILLDLRKLQVLRRRQHLSFRRCFLFRVQTADL